jgi:hypothetical protein
METLKVIHEGCGGELKHLYNRRGIRHGELVDLEVFQCQECCQIVDHEVPSDDISNIDLSFLS